MKQCNNIIKRKDNPEDVSCIIIFVNDDLNLKIQFEKNVNWIIINNILCCFNDVLKENGFEKHFFYRNKCYL